MADLTPNYQFNLPIVDGSEDQWGDLLNQNWSQVDTELDQLGTELEQGLSAAVQRTNHTGTQPISSVNGLQTALDDAVQRANHTGTQPISSVSGLQAALDDRVETGQVGQESVSTSTGTQTVVGALNDRVNQGEVGSESVSTSTGSQSVSNALDDRLNRNEFNLNDTADLVLSVPSTYDTIYDAYQSIKNTNLPVGARVRIEVSQGSYSGGDWNTMTEVAHTMGLSIDIVGLGSGASITANMNGSSGVPTSFGTLKPFLHVTVPMGRITNISISGSSTSGNNVGGLLITGAGYAKTDARYEFTTVDDEVFGIAVFDGGRVDASGADVSGCGNRDEFDSGGTYVNGDPNADSAGHGLWVRNGSSAVSDNLVANRCGDIGVHASRASSISGADMEAEDCAHHNIMATRASYIYCSNGMFRNALDDCMVSYSGSTIDAQGSDCSGARDDHGIVATRSSTINIEFGTINDCGDDNVVANHGSTINMNDATATGSARDNVGCLRGSTVSCQNADLRNAGRKGVLAFEGATVEMNGADASGAGDRGIEATRGSRINARNANTSGAGGDDVNLFGGSWINFTGATGTIPGSIEVNGINNKGTFFN